MWFVRTSNIVRLTGTVAGTAGEQSLLSYTAVQGYSVQTVYRYLPRQFVGITCQFDFSELDPVAVRLRLRASPRRAVEI